MRSPSSASFAIAEALAPQPSSARASFSSPEQLPRPKTLRRERISGFQEAVTAASQVTQLHMRVRANVRVLANLLGVGKSRAHKLQDPAQFETLTIADVLFLSQQEGDSEAACIARSIGRGIAADIARISELGEPVSNDDGTVA